MTESGNGFELKVRQREYMSTQDSEVDAILVVSADAPHAAPGAEPEAAEVIMIDCSGSMSVPRTKIAAARRAAAAAVDTLRDGTFFALVEGTEKATMAYPSTRTMAVANADTKAEAKAATARLIAGGGTAMGTWLSLARELLDEHPTAIRHALLLTDGRNIGESAAQLDRVLARCEGRFFCDARGIGAGWEPNELRRIVSVLRGQADAIREDADLVDDFRALTESAMSKVIPDLRIRVMTRPGTRLLFVKQVYPAEVDLSAGAVSPETGAVEFSTGSWSARDSREYQVRLEVDHDGRPKDEDIEVATVDLAALWAGASLAERCVPPKSILAHWTDDPTLSVVDDPAVSHYAGQAEINLAVLAGCDAYDGGRLDEARQEWGRAVQLASESGNHKILERLARLVVIVDAAAGTVEIRPNLRAVDLLSAEIGANLSSRRPPTAEELNAGADGPDVHCAHCGRACAATDAFCEGCGRPLRMPGQPDAGSPS